MKKNYNIISIILVLHLSCSLILSPKKPESGAAGKSVLVGLIQTDINRVISVNDISPTSGFIGDTVTINGANLDKVEKIGFPGAGQYSGYDFTIPDPNDSYYKLYLVSPEIISRSSISIKIKIPSRISIGTLYLISSNQTKISSLFTLKRRFFISAASASSTNMSLSSVSSDIAGYVSKFNCNGDSAKPSSSDSKDTYYALLGYYIPRLSASFYTDPSNPYPSFTVSTSGSVSAGQYGLNSSGNAWYGSSSTNYSSTADCSGWNSTSLSDSAYIQNLSGIISSSPSTTAACNTAAKVICIQFSY